MSSGKVVLTSKEPVHYQKAKKLVEAEYDCGVINPFRIEEQQDAIIWKFVYEEDAITHARIFMNMGFSFVQRVI